MGVYFCGVSAPLEQSASAVPNDVDVSFERPPEVRFRKGDGAYHDPSLGGPWIFGWQVNPMLSTHLQ